MGDGRNDPRITHLINVNQRLTALELFRQAERYGVASQALDTVRQGVLVVPRVSFETAPPGARVYISDYPVAAGDDLAQWRLLGVTPFEANEIPVTVSTVSARSRRNLPRRSHI